MLSDLLLKEGDFPKAIEMATAACRSNPSRADAWWSLRDAWGAAGEHLEALDALKSLVENVPETRKAVFKDARVLCEERDDHELCELVYDEG